MTVNRLLTSCRVLPKHTDSNTMEECFVINANNCKQSDKLIAFLGSEWILTWFKVDNNSVKIRKGIEVSYGWQMGLIEMQIPALIFKSWQKSRNECVGKQCEKVFFTLPLDKIFTYIWELRGPTTMILVFAKVHATEVGFDVVAILMWLST